MSLMFTSPPPPNSPASNQVGKYIILKLVKKVMHRMSMD